MRNINVLLSAIVLLVGALAGVFYFQNQRNKDEVEKYKPYPYINSISFDEFKTKYDNQDEFFVYIGRPDCGDSRQFEKEFTQYFVEFDKDGNFAQLKYDLGNKQFYYFDISEIIESTKSIDQRNFYKQYGFYYTPSLLHYKDGQVVNIAEWDPVFGFEVTDYLKWFYDTNLISPKNEVYHEGPTDRN